MSWAPVGDGVAEKCTLRDYGLESLSLHLFILLFIHPFKNFVCVCVLFFCLFVCFRIFNIGFLYVILAVLKLIL